MKLAVILLGFTCIVVSLAFFLVLGWMAVFSLGLFGVTPARQPGTFDYIIVGGLLAILARLNICEVTFKYSSD